MIDKVKKNECVLCGACAHVCPKQSISLNESYCSFHYPVIDRETCISCNLCEKVCPAIHVPEAVAAKQYLAAKNKSNDILKISSSGGIFYPLAKAVIEHGGSVCGAAFDENFDVKHMVVDSVTELEKLCGSKYVQSDLSTCYSAIRERLRQGKTVLFTGCPCQTAAVKNIFRNQENLVLVDFICHGAVSAEVFAEYKQYLQKKYKGKIIDFAFRNKQNGWLFSGPSVAFDNGSRYQSALAKDLYMQGYFNNLNLKEACYSCSYKNYHSGSDITLGDFWGIQHLIPDFYEYDGNSLIVINTETGQKWMQQIQEELETREVSESDILVENQGLVKPFGMNEERNRYFTKARKKGFIKPLEKYIKRPLHIRLLKRVKRLIKR